MLDLSTATRSMEMEELPYLDIVFSVPLTSPCPISNDHMTLTFGGETVDLVVQNATPNEARLWITARAFYTQDSALFRELERERTSSLKRFLRWIRGH